MNRLINESSLRRFNRFVLPAAVVWTLSTLGGSFLAPVPQEGYVEQFDPFFEIFRFGEKFALSPETETVKGKTVTTTMLVPYPHRIKAIYRSGSGSFVSISDGKETSVVAQGGKYKKDFLLIGVNDRSAVFKGHGKSYRLRLGFDDPLSVEQTVTRTVADMTRPQYQQNEWRTIPRHTVMEQVRDVQKIFKRIAIREVRKGGKIDGFRILSIDPQSVFASVGLQTGDVIVAVNNKKLLSYGDAFSVYNQIPRMHSVQISILRNNLPKDIVYEITR